VRLHDVRRRRTEALVSADGEARLYVCGITPYDTTHLGHAFTYLVFDVLGRNLRRQGLRVTYVQNVTDVDDDLLRRARRDQRNWQELAEENVRIFRADLEALNVTPPNVYPYASRHIEGMIEMIARLFEQGQAYRAGGNVYFRVSCFPRYGELSGFSREMMIKVSAERGADPNDPNKEDPLDFILWQAAAPDEPSWPTPWGPGRPGWHIECSAMSYQYLGPRIEIHGGGSDLVFPHHESEIAQSESYSGEHPYCGFWMHTAMLRYQGEKMSKSLGNMLFVRDLRRDYSADAIRLALLNHHYREDFDFEERELDVAQTLADRLRAAASQPPATGGEGPALELAREGLSWLDHDLSTHRAIGSLRGLLELPASASRGVALHELGGALGLTFAPKP
jgi:L-cysteine:1D-myo-inositol 2-amino-2-deoxy-alpha-D-glucopyranoside ligase